MDMVNMKFEVLENNRDNFKTHENIQSKLLWGSRHPVKDPFITILIITYKRPQLFYKAFMSTLVQMEVNFSWEVVIIDNHPQETEVLKIVTKANDSRVRYYRNRENIGHEGSMNRGITLADGKWVALLHDDDLLVRNYLILIEQYINAASRWKMPLAYIRARHICFEKDANVQRDTTYHEIEAPFFVKPELWIETLLRGCGPTYVNSCGSLVNREAFLRAGGYNPLLNPICDATLGLLFMNLGYSIYASERILGFYRQGKNLSAKKETVLRLICADYLLREYLYRRNWMARIFGHIFRGVQFRESVDAKLELAKKYHGESPAKIPSMDEINQIYRYQKHTITKFLLKILQNIVDIGYRQRRFSRWFLQYGKWKKKQKEH